MMRWLIPDEALSGWVVRGDYYLDAYYCGGVFEFFYLVRREMVS